MKFIALMSIAVGLSAGVDLLAQAVAPQIPASISSDRASAAVGFRRDIEPLFAKNCVFCHMKEGPDAGLILEPGFAYAMIVGVASTESSLQRVVPGNPDRSYLLLKMQNRHLAAGGKGSKMPIVPGGISAKLLTATPDQIDVVRTWILSGARDN